jgi:hypothetical protein
LSCFTSASDKPVVMAAVTVDMLCCKAHSAAGLWNLLPRYLTALNQQASSCLQVHLWHHWQCRVPEVAFLRFFLTPDHALPAEDGVDIMDSMMTCSFWCWHSNMSVDCGAA